MPDPLTHGQMSKTLFARQFSQTSQASGFSDVLSTSSDRKVISQKSKKKPDPVDVALETDGLCRKLMPRDGNTIFRAVSDQLYGTQAYQDEVREQLLKYFYDKQEELQQIIEHYQSSNTFIDYIIQKMVCAVQSCFSVDVNLFDENGKKNVFYLSDVATLKAKSTVLLSVDRQLCWDSVQSIDYLRVQGLCQSVIYEILYEKVFKLKNVSFAVENMLGKPKKSLQQAGKCKPNKEAMLSLLTNSQKDASLTLDLKVLIDMGIPPFPYKVAKSLSPYVYRNIEYDVCEAVKGSNSENIKRNFLFEGCKCIIHKRSNYRYYGYVQRLFPEQNKAIVFVEQLGEMCEIAIDLIEPVIVTKKSSSRSRRRSRYTNRSSYMDRDDMEFPEGDEDMLEDDVFVELEEPVDEQIDEEEEEEDIDVEEESPKEPEPVQMEVVAPAPYSAEQMVAVPLATNVYQHQMAFSVVPSQVVHIVDTAYNCIVAIYGPYNGAKVPGFQGLINKSAIPSYLPDGSDLPFSDMSTLRFFYNLGQKHFQAALYTLFVDQGAVGLLQSTEELPQCSKFHAHLLAPDEDGKPGTYPFCQYIHDMSCACKTASDKLQIKCKKGEVPIDFGNTKWAASVEKCYEDVLNGNPACLNLIPSEKTCVCRSCMFHFFGSYFAHYPKAFPFPVNLCSQPSMMEDGSDLPFQDICSLRYFFNLGIKNHQSAELTFLHQQGRIDYQQMFGEWPDQLSTTCAIHSKFQDGMEENDTKIACDVYNVYRNALEKQFCQNINLISHVTVRPVQMHTFFGEVPLSSYVMPGSSQLVPYGGCF